MRSENPTWPQRPWALAILLAVSAYLFHLVAEEKILEFLSTQNRVSLLAFISVAAIACSFSLEQDRWKWSLLFSFTWAIIIAFVAHSTFSHEGWMTYSFCSGVLAAGIALPLFQTIREHGRAVLPYEDLHKHAWSGLLCLCVGTVFVGFSFGLIHLLAQLFDLIGVELLTQLLKEEWFTTVFLGGAFGASLGVLKENQGIIASIQNLVVAVLSILAPALGFGLAVFLIALPFTGLERFWDATSATTPILLSCALAAITLANAIIRNSSSEESSNKVMRYSAIGLAACVLPLALIALVSMQQRIGQYGFTPDRLWGLVVTLLVLAYGIFYFWSIIMSRHQWASNIRTSNTRMAIVLCITTLLLALPVINFEQISVKSQLTRIGDKNTMHERIDFVAFAFDFGKSGRDVLNTMEASDNKILAKRATMALVASNRWELRAYFRAQNIASRDFSDLQVFPPTENIPDQLRRLIAKQGGCLGEYCLLIWEPGSHIARLLTADCQRDYQPYQDERGYAHCPPRVRHLRLGVNGWEVGNRFNYRTRPNRSSNELNNQDRKAISLAVEQGEIEIRTVQRKQIFIAGKPVAQAFE